MRVRRWFRVSSAATLLCAAGVLAAGCGGASRGYGAMAETMESSGSESSAYDAWQPQPASASFDAYGGGASRSEEAELTSEPMNTTGLAIRIASAPRAPQPVAPAIIAQADPRSREASTPPAASTTPREQAQAEAAQTATDAVDTSGPLLIYTATMHLAVYEVAESQERIVAAARELGGFVFTQADDRLVVRVPALRFHALIEQVAQAGDVVHREVQAQDVSEEFHDVEIRIRNLEAMRSRVEALLAQAQTVEDALRVEQELHRITDELERMRGRQRFLADRIAFSTITVFFRPRPRELVGQPDVFELPFAWLEQLGLATLLDLR